METSFKNWLCPKFLLLPKKSELPKIWGGSGSPPRHPGPYAYGTGSRMFKVENMAASGLDGFLGNKLLFYF